MLANLSAEQLQRILSEFSEDELFKLKFDWRSWARASQLPPDGAWTVWMLMGGRGLGKCIDIRTPLPTPSGWRTLADVSPGDQVFDEAGNPTTVLAVYDSIPKRAYRLTFSDGTWIDACDQHQWVTWTHRDRKQFYRHESPTAWPARWPLYRGIVKSRWGHVVGEYGPAIRTTQQIVDTLRYGKRGDLNHCIPTCGALQYPKRDLPLDPYALGYWLGNGSHLSGTISAGDADELAIRALFEAAGVSTSDRADANAFGALGVVGALRALGVLANKHVPRLYLEASVEQRRALLAGLMDSDGYADHRSTVEFCNMNRQLAESVLELARSLGNRPVLWEGEATLDGRSYGTRYRVTWSPVEPVFRLPRKAERLRFGGEQGMRRHHRMIVGAELIDPCPMRCLTVSAPTAMFLVGEGMIPTHNTRTGAEWIRSRVEAGVARRIYLVGATASDARDIMVEGESGIMSVCPPWNKPLYEPSKRRLTWPNGAVATLFSAEEPERLRGPQGDTAWCDEIGAWTSGDAWDQMMLGLRLGRNPQALATTTPRPTAFVRSILHRPDTVVTRGTTYDNKRNLAPAFLTTVLKKYEGTRLGRQEVLGELLEDTPGALWSAAMIENTRWRALPEGWEWGRVVVGVDPAVTSHDESDETGIVVCGRGAGAWSDHYVVLSDKSGRHPVTSSDPTTKTWAAVAVEAYRAHMADCLVAERNNGGDLVAGAIAQVAPDVGVRVVVATKGKAKRAEPIALLWEQRRAHVLGMHHHLEDQMTTFQPDDPTASSPDRMDAMVWAMTELTGGEGLVVL
jgi:phage terminase large subunit-like protein